jgi:hypothetical protein
MAIKGLVAISYCLAFLGVYLGSIAYAFILKGLKDVYGMVLPSTASMNAISSNAMVMNATMGVTSFTGLNGWFVIGGVVFVATILVIMVSSRNMAAAI